MRYQAVLFDLDNTLYDYDLCYRAADDVIFPLLEERTGRPRAELEALLQESRRYNQITLGGTAAAHNRLLYYQHLVELLGFKPFGLADTICNLFWDTFLARMRLFPGALELLSAIRSNSKICLVTDMPVETQYRKIARLGLADAIDAIVTSEEAGVEKPHPWVFALALRKLGVPADRACMVGDDYKDIEGALLSGLDAWWVPPQGQVQAYPEAVRQSEELRRQYCANRLILARDLFELRDLLLAAESREHNE
ncbi:MAG: HAD family hydrolase [Spirochaetota bacterium]|nr:HAD family hydrolase [Spirochaetota bacterium]